MNQFLFLDKAYRGIWAVGGDNITLQNTRKHSADQVLDEVRGGRWVGIGPQ